MNRIRKLLEILADRNLSKALLHGAAAGVEHTRVLRPLRCCSVVDIGANRGQFALVARKCFPEAEIHSFEPLQEPAAVFEKVFCGDTRTHLYRCAVGPQEVRREMQVSRRDDSSSFLAISPLQVRHFPGTGMRTVREVCMKPLHRVLAEAHLQAPALLKLDVQGYELGALEGCAQLMASFALIYAECSFIELYAGQPLAHQVISYLSGHGFQLAGVYNLSYAGSGLAIQGDFLFARQVTRE